MHIVTHFIQKTDDQIREYLRNYILSRLDWFQKVSKHFLDRLSTSIESYIDSISTTAVPFDMLALYVIARMYRFHFGLILNARQWCSNADKYMNKCMFILVFRGPTDLCETCNTGCALKYEQSLRILTNKGLMPSHCTENKKVDEEDNLVFVGMQEPAQKKT